MLLPRPEIRITMRFMPTPMGLRFVAVPRADPADPVDRLAGRRRAIAERTLRILLRDHHDHADSAVEHAEHLLVGHATLALQPVEQRRPWPGVAVELSRQAVGQYARHIFQQAAAGDVRQALDLDLLHQRQHRLHVDARGREDRLAQRAAVKSEDRSGCARSRMRRIEE